MAVAVVRAFIAAASVAMIVIDLSLLVPVSVVVIPVVMVVAVVTVCATGIPMCVAMVAMVIIDRVAAPQGDQRCSEGEPYHNLSYLHSRIWRLPAASQGHLWAWPADMMAGLRRCPAHDMTDGMQETPSAVSTDQRAFDNDRYLAEQTAAILDRVARFDNKLYLEFGGKLLFDYHAARVLPGFDPNVKMRLLHQLRDKTEIIICIYAGHIENRKIRLDFGITYHSDVFKLIDDLREWDLEVRAVVITRYTEQPAAAAFKARLERRGVPVYTHGPLPGYPTDIDRIASDEGWGACQRIETTKPLVVVTGPGPNSGKMATCLSQVYHEHRRGVHAGYAKFETFPIWNLPLRHPVNAAYEAATSELRDVNMLDPFHLEAYNERAVNYNRDIESFPLLRRILARISGDNADYRSPTDMGVNRAGFAIIDDAVAMEAARQEIIRRYFRYACEYALGSVDLESVARVERLMKEFELSPESRRVVLPAHRAAAEAEGRAGKGNAGVYCGAAIALRDGSIVTGCNSPLMHAASSLVFNSVKKLAGIPPHLDLISKSLVESIGALKTDILKRKSISLDLEEALVALSCSSTTSPVARLAMEHLKDLAGCEVHLTHIPSPADDAGLRRLGVNLTCNATFATDKLFVA